MKVSEERYRLRIGHQIAGYSKVAGNSIFYSKDGFWWNGTSIYHEIADECTHVRDKNDRMLYEHDIVSVRFRNPFKRSELFRIRKGKEGLELVHLEKEYTEPLAVLTSCRSVTFVSHTFLNIELIFPIAKP